MNAKLIIHRAPPEILKKQASQNNAEYDRLATELNDLTGNKSNKRVD
jgi:B-cell receptor-associated protein 31